MTIVYTPSGLSLGSSAPDVCLTLVNLLQRFKSQTVKSFSQIWKANEIPDKPIDWADIDYDIDFWHCIYEWCVNIVLGWLTVLLAGSYPYLRLIRKNHNVWFS